MAKRLRRVNPNHLSAISIALAAAAGAMLYLSSEQLWLMPLASVVIALSALLDALDGKVARLTGRASIRGDFLDHVLDRYADIFLLLGIILSGYCNWLIGILAMTGVLMTSYMGTQAQAVGAGRNYGGILGRADRLVLLILLPIIFYLLAWLWDMTVLVTLPYLDLPLTLLDIMMLWFAIAGHFTALQRGVRTWRGLGKKRTEN